MGRPIHSFVSLLVVLAVLTSVSCSDLQIGQDVESLTDSNSSGDSSWSGWRSPTPPERIPAGEVTTGDTTTGEVATIDPSGVLVQWRTPLPAGTSSPTVWFEHIFVTYETDQDRVGLLCIDSAGSIAWQQPLARATGPTHRKTGQAAATPATNGELIYASFGQAGLFCLTHDGQLVWQAGEHRVEHQWGHAASPLLAGDRVIQLADGQEGSFLAAYDSATGERIWKTPRESNGCWSSPILFTHPETGREWVVVNGSGRNSGPGEVTGYDLETGAESWSMAGTSSTPAPTAVVFRDRILSASGNHGPILSIQIDGLGRATETWRNASGGPYVPTGLVVDDLFVQLEDNGKLTCYSAMTGERHWVHRLRGPFTASVIDLGDQILVASENGELTFVTLQQDACQISATRSIGGRVLATPAYADGRLYVRTADGLICMGSASGKPTPLAIKGESLPTQNVRSASRGDGSRRDSIRGDAEGSVLFQRASE